MGTVRCADCGYLSLQESDTRRLVEVEIKVRQDWKQLKTIPGERGPRYESRPMCFARVADLPREAGGSDAGQIRAIVEAERDCPAFTPWLYGRTPREHEEMSLIEERRRNDLAWQEERRREDAKARDDAKAVENSRQDARDAQAAATQTARDARLEAFQREQNEKNRALQFRNMLIGGLLALLGGAVVSYLMPKPQAQIVVAPTPTEAKAAP